MYRKTPIIPPWGGWDNSAPALTLPSNSFKQITNWLINKQRLVAFPQMVNMFPPLSGDLNDIILGARTFQDKNGVFHTMLLLPDRVKFLNPDQTTTQIGAAWPSTITPYAVEVYQNQVYFTNGTAERLKYVDGSNNWFVAGNVPGSSFFLGKLAARLLMLNTVENGFQYVNRVRWSAVNNANEWDSVSDYTAGATDIPEVEDQLTGWATINNIGFAFRNNGITAFSPTGIGATPWFIENFSIGPTGIGCAYPYSLSVYGTLCAFAALDDIYVFTGQAPTAIGGKAKKSIFRDLNNASDVTVGTLMGTLGPGIDYLAYWLSCPQENNTTSMWIYHFDDQSWVNVQLPYGWLFTLANIALT